MKAPLIRHWDIFAWGLVLFGLTGLCVCFAYEEWGIRRQFNETALTATGVVIEASPGWHTGGLNPDGESPSTKYRFKTSDGTEHAGESNEEYVPAGETVEVEYCPSDPQSNRIKGTDPFKTNAGGYLLFAFIAASIGCCFFATVGPKNTAPTSGMPFAGVPMIVLCSASAYMLFSAISDGRSHAYYQILRWLVFLSCIVVSLNAHRWGHHWIPWLFGVVAILFNPVAPIHLPRASWCVIDMVAAVVMLSAAFWMKPKPPAMEHPPV